MANEQLLMARGNSLNVDELADPDHHHDESVLMVTIVHLLMMRVYTHHGNNSFPLDDESVYSLGWVNFSEFEITVCGSCKMSK